MPSSNTQLGLPGVESIRWTPKRKAKLLAEIRSGNITIEGACKKYRMTVDEIQSWQQREKQHGLKGLRATRAKEYRVA